MDGGKHKDLTYQFQLTRLLRGVTLNMQQIQTCQAFQLTRLLRGVTFVFNTDVCDDKIISTHTPLARRDIQRAGASDVVLRISTHTPLARRDRKADGNIVGPDDFNSHASCEA